MGEIFQDVAAAAADMAEGGAAYAATMPLLTRPDRLESVTLLVAALELVRLKTASAHQREPVTEIYLTPTGNALFIEELADA
jgi:hypothetical protein